jgi:hypothetical protein
MRSAPHLDNMIIRHTSDVWLAATPRAAVFGAFRRLRGVSQATFRESLFIFRFTNRRF